MAEPWQFKKNDRIKTFLNITILIYVPPLIADAGKKIASFFFGGEPKYTVIMMESSMTRLIKWRMRAGFY